MNFRDEREHDERLMLLICNLHRIGRLDILETRLNLPLLGQLNGLRRCRAFDVKATFENRDLLIETKVDSDEGYRWEATLNNDPSLWQTARIARLAKEQDVCLFITYGFSEFFTKPLDFGPASPRFRHVTLDMMINLLDAALNLKLIEDPRLNEWALALHQERAKRQRMPDVLCAFANFRRTYLGIAGEADFTLGRIGFNGPEMAFPIFAKLLDEWARGPGCQRYGRLALYPVGRRGLPVDSILNWWEFWFGGTPLTIGGVVQPEERSLYLEINEDFNLHLKLEETAGQYVHVVRQEVACRLTGHQYAAPIIASRPEFHMQGAYAVWEWDLDIPTLICKFGYKAAVNALIALLDEIVPRLQ